MAMFRYACSEMFPTTRRSIVLALSSGEAPVRERAFDTLVAVYWKPVYKYLRLRGARTREDAEDLTQSFFVRAFEKETLASYDATRASFRGFLRLLLDRHSSNETKAAGRQKRGGGFSRLDFESAESEIGRDDTGPATPEALFQREWVRSALALALERLREACRETGRSPHLALFEAYDLDGEDVSYADLGRRFGLSESTVTNHLASVRRQFRQIVLDTLREITATDAEFRAEARAFFGADR
jgi:RNA polymerase sigma factor (sigma-70 family)